MVVRGLKHSMIRMFFPRVVGFYVVGFKNICLKVCRFMPFASADMGAVFHGEGGEGNQCFDGR